LQVDQSNSPKTQNSKKGEKTLPKKDDQEMEDVQAKQEEQQKLTGSRVKQIKSEKEKRKDKNRVRDELTSWSAGLQSPTLNSQTHADSTSQKSQLQPGSQNKRLTRRSKGKQDILYHEL